MTDTYDLDPFEQLLERIRAAEHPDYCTLSYDGERRVVSANIKFEPAANKADPEEIRQRALRYLTGLTPEERAVLDIDIQMHNGVPVRAVLKGLTKDLPIERLQELERRMNGVT